MLFADTIVKTWALASLALAAPTAGQDAPRLRSTRRLTNPFNDNRRDDVPASQQGNQNNMVPIEMLPKKTVPSVNRAKVAAEDAEREARGGPIRIAVDNALALDASEDGAWEVAADGTKVWRLRVKTSGCNSLSFGFCGYRMPAGGKLHIYDSKGRTSISRPFTSDDNKGGQLWTPVIESCDAMLEVNLAEETSTEDLMLSLCSVQVGYRGLGTRPEAQHGNKPRRKLQQSGSCNNDVACSLGDEWRDEISSVAGISFLSDEGSFFCTGAMINNQRQDGTPYFLTAHHCGVRSSNAATLVAYWNYEKEGCNGPNDGSKAQFTVGSTFRAGSKATDFTLVELDSAPESTWGVSFAGWDMRDIDATSAVGIHHPDGDVKKISFEDDPTTTDSWSGKNLDHVKVVDWDSGTTEPGSSGSPLFNQNHHIIGQLHGGSAACGNDSPDYYGKLAVSWSGKGTDSTRLSNWLDPDNSGVQTVDTLGGGSTFPPTTSSQPTDLPTPYPSTSPSVSSMPTVSTTSTCGRKKDECNGTNLLCCDGFVCTSGKGNQPDKCQ